jgi:UDP:flavonoid glycosyltransferase YjiC (YdhE family)
VGEAAPLLAVLAYVFVEKATDDFPAELRKRIPGDPPLHFVTLVSAPNHQAFVVLNTDTTAEADDLVDQNVGPAGGTNPQVTYRQLKGTDSLRYK